MEDLKMFAIINRHEILSRETEPNKYYVKVVEGHYISFKDMKEAFRFADSL